MQTDLRSDDASSDGQGNVVRALAEHRGSSISDRRNTGRQLVGGLNRRPRVRPNPPTDSSARRSSTCLCRTHKRDADWGPTCRFLLMVSNPSPCLCHLHSLVGPAVISDRNLTSMVLQGQYCCKVRKVITLISLKGFARRRKLGYTTIRGYYRDGRLPKQDGWLTDDPDGDPPPSTSDDRPATGSDEGTFYRPGWLPATIDNWERPGQGSRTDLKAPIDTRRPS